MYSVLENVDNLIKKLNNTDFVINMKLLKKGIDINSFINTDNVKELYKNDLIHKYVENQNILDYHIYYLNSSINKLIDNKICKE